MGEGGGVGGVGWEGLEGSKSKSKNNINNNYIAGQHKGLRKTKGFMIGN